MSKLHPATRHRTLRMPKAQYWQRFDERAGDIMSSGITMRRRRVWCMYARLGLLKEEYGNIAA